MTKQNARKTGLAVVLSGGLVLLAGCSGPTEDVRVTLCKNLTQSLVGGAIEWTGGENTFKRPEYAITALQYSVEGKSGERRSGESACHFAYEALEDTAVILADPIQAYATLPFAMTVDGRTLSDAELLQSVNAEQKRQGRRVVETLEKGARDMADKVRAGIGQ